MKRFGQLLLFLFLLLLLPHTSRGADKAGVTFYLQLIRGTDDDKPPVPEAILIGPALSHRLHMFKWKNYWDVAHRSVEVASGQKTRQRMSPQREVEVSLTSPKEMTISIFADGKLSRRRVQPLETNFYIAGGDKDGEQAWFIVVRRDKPQGAEVSLK
jgi:hypothetical protein